jgi:hypothetical protein
LLWVQRVHLKDRGGDGVPSTIRSDSLGESRDIDIIPRCVSLHREPCLNAEHLVDGRKRNLPVCSLDDGRLERRDANEVADAGVDSIELPEDQNRPLDSCGIPVCDAFQLRKHSVKSIFEVGYHMVVVARKAMIDIHRGGAAPHEDRIGYDLLKVRRGRENAFPILGVLDRP